MRGAAWSLHLRKSTGIDWVTGGVTGSARPPPCWPVTGRLCSAYEAAFWSPTAWVQTSAHFSLAVSTQAAGLTSQECGEVAKMPDP